MTADVCTRAVRAHRVGGGEYVTMWSLDPTGARRAKKAPNAGGGDPLVQEVVSGLSPSAPIFCALEAICKAAFVDVMVTAHGPGGRLRDPDPNKPTHSNQKLQFLAGAPDGYKDDMGQRKLQNWKIIGNSKFGGIYYQGEMLDGKLDGRGIKICYGQALTIGHFKEGKPHGRQVSFFHDGKLNITGYCDNKKDGKEI